MKKIFLWILCLCLFTLSFQAAASEKFVIEAIGGASTVSVKRGSTHLQLKKTEELQLGDSLETNSSTVVDLRYPDNSLVRIGVNSSFTIEKKNPLQKELVSIWVSKLIKGFVRILVPESKQKNTIKFEIDTPTGTIGVRGTEFVVEHNNKQTNVHTLQGEVLAGPANAIFSEKEKFVTVVKGLRSKINFNAKPSTPEKFPLENYLKKIDADSEENPFSALHSRKSGGEENIVRVIPKKKSSEAEQMTKKLENKKDVTEEDQSNANDEYLRAVLMNDIDGVQKYADAGAEVDFSLRDSGDGPMHVAVALKNSTALIVKLKSLGVQVNKRNRKGYTPLMIVAEIKDDIEEIKFLVANGADISLTNNAGETAYVIAKKYGHRETASLLKQLAEQ